MLSFLFVSFLAVKSWLWNFENPTQAARKKLLSRNQLIEVEPVNMVFVAPGILDDHVNKKVS